MTFTEYLLKNWGLVAVCALSGLTFLLLPLIRNRFSPATGLSTLEATRLINAGSIMILDVRSPAEYDSGHLNRAVNIPLEQLAERLSEVEKKSAKNVLVYCSHGHRSARAGKILAKTGKNICNLKGGITAWKAANLPTEQKPTPNTGSGKNSKKTAAPTETAQEVSLTKTEK